MLALQNCRWKGWTQGKYRITVSFNVAATLLFIISLQPYAAAFLFLFLLIKALLLVKIK